MLYLDSYEIFENKQTDEEIHALCEKYNIENYTINLDKSIDVNGNINLANRGLTELPLKFRNVSGYFNCNRNNLRTLKGAPEYVHRGFACSYNKLNTLKGAPRYIGGNLIITHNKMFSLEGFPDKFNELLCEFTPVYYFWFYFMDLDKDLLFSFVEDWDVIREDLVVIELLEAYVEENNIKTKIDIEYIKSLGYRIE